MTKRSTYKPLPWRGWLLIGWFLVGVSLGLMLGMAALVIFRDYA